MPELRTARENARLEIGSQRGRNSHQIGVLGIYDLRGLSYGRTELLAADMRLLEPAPGVMVEMAWGQIPAWWLAPIPRSHSLGPVCDSGTSCVPPRGH